MPGVVDQHVDLAELAATTSATALSRRLVGDVAAQHQRCGAGRDGWPQSSTATVKPSLRSWAQMARPMPEPPPVTTAVRGGSSEVHQVRLARPQPDSWMKCSGLRNSSFSSAMSSMVKPSGRRIR